AMQRVVGIEIGDQSVAYALESVSGGEGRVTSATLDDAALAIFWKAGQASALDSNELSDGYDVGSVAVFHTSVAGDALTFSFVDGNFVDEESGSVWSITGEAVEGPHKGAQLESVPHLDSFWFAWSTYRPETALIEG
ncbi:MAG: DUF3179 domain-containing (seleno)protein, partial [Acidimicrobiia bacterium]